MLRMNSAVGISHTDGEENGTEKSSRFLRDFFRSIILSVFRLLSTAAGKHDAGRSLCQEAGRSIPFSTSLYSPPTPPALHSCA